MTRLSGPAALVVVAWRAGADREEAWNAVTRCALDSMPAIRRSLLEVLIDGEDVETSAVAETLGYPTSTTRRGLKDFTAHRLVHRTAGGKGNADTWRMTAWAAERYAAVRNLSRFVTQSGEGDEKRDSGHPTFRERSETRHERDHQRARLARHLHARSRRCGGTR
jgi:DeoR/GlpR family transcriptional regulator of sugar metabolism